MKHLESNIQITCVQYFRLNYPDYIIFHIPNGGSRNIREGARLKKEGVLAGVPDLEILLPSGRHIFIEIKTAAGKQHATQKAFQKTCKRLEHEYYVCRGVEHFIDTVRELLKDI